MEKTIIADTGKDNINIDTVEVMEIGNNHTENPEILANFRVKEEGERTGKCRVNGGMTENIKRRDRNWAMNVKNRKSTSS